MATSAEGTLFVRDSRTSLEYEIPISGNTVSATDFRQIKNTTSGPSFIKASVGMRLYDPGLQNTGVKRSQISGRDTESGLPMYRGYTTRQLWDCEFEEVFHLMVWGKYPSAAARDTLRRKLAQKMMGIPEIVVQIVRGFPRSSPPMPMLLAGLSAWVAAEPESIPAIKGKNIYHGNLKLVDDAIIKTTAAYAAVLGLATSHRKGIAFAPASMDRTFLENLFAMMGKRPDPRIMSCFRRTTILNADNGMTQSTLVFLAAASSLTDPMSSLISAVAAAYGPLHYGAQEAMFNNLTEIGKVENVGAFLEQVKKRERRLFGYGHRSFAVEDPRLAPVKEMLVELECTQETDPLMKIANEIDNIASTDVFFKSRGLRANADFYTLFLFKSMGFDSDEIATANLSQRLIGFMAHWRESMEQEIKIFRALDLYTGPRKSGASISRESKL